MSGGLYGEMADLYDRIYHWKDYPAECERLRGWLTDAGVGPGSRLLEAACGTGEHMRHLMADYAIAGFDLNPAMIALARGKLPGAQLLVADMRTFEVGEPVDGLLCLFSSIGYLTDERQLRAAAERFAAALRPGGVAIVEPWLTPEAFTAGHPSLHTFEDEQIKLARAVVGQLEGDRSIFDFHWLIAVAGEGVAHRRERHVLWLCPRATMDAAFADAGFDCRWEDEGLMPGRGLLIATRRG